MVGLLFKKFKEEALKLFEKILFLIYIFKEKFKL